MLLSKFHPSLRGAGLLNPFVSTSRNFVAKTAITNATEHATQKTESKVVVANKRNIGQSPFRMRFLARLVRNAWVPDALAQMKFSPKHKAEDVAKIIKVTSLCIAVFLILTCNFFRERVHLPELTLALFQRSF